MKPRILLMAAATCFATPAMAQQMAASDSTENVVVYGILPGSDIGLSADKLPGSLQSLGSQQLTARHGATLLNAVGSQAAGVSLSDVQGKALHAISSCRTEVLGGHLDVCADCGLQRPSYNSCRNRHCPQCQTRAKEAWLAARQREVLPVPYFHLVFTLPHDLNGLIGQCPRSLYEMLFGAVAATLTEFRSCRIIRGVASAAAGSKAVTGKKTRIQWQNRGLAREQGLHAPAAGGAAHE